MANWPNSANFCHSNGRFLWLKNPVRPGHHNHLHNYVLSRVTYMTKNCNCHFLSIFQFFFSRPHAKLNTIYENFRVLIFCAFFFSKFAIRPQAKLNTIYENFRVFMFHPLPVSMQNMRSRVLQKHNAIFLLLFFFKLQYPGVNILHMVPCIAFLNQFHSKNKIQPPKPGLRQTVNGIIRTQRLQHLRHHHRFCLTYCIIYSIKIKETSVKRSTCAHVSPKYRQRIFYWLLRAHCFLWTILISI